MNFATKNEKKEISMEFRTLLLQELIKGGVLAPWIAVSVAHGEVELKLTFDAYERALNVYKKALEDGIDKYLVGPAVKPVFRKFN